jgi:hypothetical protein
MIIVLLHFSAERGFKGNSFLGKKDARNGNPPWCVEAYLEPHRLTLVPWRFIHGVMKAQLGATAAHRGAMEAHQRAVKTISGHGSLP